MTPGRERGTLAGLIERLAGDVDRLDEAFARALAAALHRRAAHLSLPEVDALGFEDVMVTFTMDGHLSLMVTGTLSASGGEGSVRWHERDFPRVAVSVSSEPRDDAYTFATLDFSMRGRRGRVVTATGDLSIGSDVTVRCLATVGEVATYRVVTEGRESSAPVSAIRLLTGLAE